MSSVSVFAPLRRRDYYVDTDGAISFTKALDDEKKVTWNLTDYLESGETVSSAAYVDSGVTTSSKSVSSPSVIFTATGLGETKVTATLSTSRTVEQTFRFRPPLRSIEKDYQG